MSCENTNSVYTYKSQSYCNGWSGISLEKCIAKCTMNDVPSLCRRQQVECAYVIYHHLNKWCHLGDAICRPKPHRIVRNYIYKKEGDILNFSFQCFFRKKNYNHQNDVLYLDLSKVAIVCPLR